MINIVVYHNSIGGAYTAAQQAIGMIGAQVGTRICSKQPYNSMLPVWPNLRELRCQLVSFEIATAPTSDLISELRLDFEGPGFEGKIAIVVYHHDDPQSEATARYIQWRLGRLIDHNRMNPHVRAWITPPNIPIFDDLIVNYRVVDTDALDLQNGGADWPVAEVLGTFIPTTKLVHVDRAQVFGHGDPIERMYFQHPPHLDKSITVSLIPKDDGFAVCAAQFDQMSYAVTLGDLLWLNPQQMLQFQILTHDQDLVIASGDTPLDLFYEMLFLLFNDALDF